MDLIEELSRLPAGWRYVAVNANKQPYQKNWQHNPLKRSELFTEIKSGKAKAIGVVAGEKSGVMFLDHDGQSASDVLTSWGLSVSSLPPSWMVTSGRVGRFQLIYKVPEKYWSKIKTKKYKSGVVADDGSVEQVELRWNACQSVVAGAHPTTSGYSWMNNRSPDDLPLATAPIELLKKMMDTKKPSIKPEIINSDIDKARSLLQSINPSRLDDYDTWIQIGMSLHSCADALLTDWIDISAAASNFNQGECEKKWQSFGKRSGVSLGTLVKYAKEDGWTPPPKTFPTSLVPQKKEDNDTSVIPKKLEQLTPTELVELLRQQQDKIQFNIFTQNVEMKNQTMKNIELFYLTLAELGFKVSKELAVDCVQKIAYENQFDPVRNYLEAVSQNVEPTFIDRLASTYLRPSDQTLQEPTIYDQMMKATLIGAVRRVMEPGCKHDYATVLKGKQGGGKSTFWQILGGQFFNDSLGDLSSKDDVLCLHRSWICEWGEIDRVTTKKEAGSIKSFLSRSTDHFRVPYGRAIEEHPRRGIIVGSTNTDGFLIDETGNRRFLVIPCETDLQNQVDFHSLEIERDSIWSAAFKAYKNKEPHYLTSEQEQQVAEDNLSYLIESPWTQPIISYLQTPNNKFKDITIELLLTEAIEKPKSFQKKGDVMQVSSILKTLGYERKRKRIEGTPKWVWEHIA